MTVADGAPYDVEVVMDPDGPRVRIVDGSRRTLADRACRDSSEARTYASTVRQHLYWLSAERFREYYGIEG